MNTETNILLPAATVELFIKDGETIQAAQRIKDDWRFARVKITVMEGDVNTAIEIYGQKKSPDLVMIETDQTDDVFTNRLGALSSQCEEGTNAIVIGHVNDVNLYRRLTGIGVSDYLVRPVPYHTLTETIAQTLINHLGTSGSRLIATIGAKGGVGVSALTQALAWGVSDQLEQKTFLMDAAGGWSSAGVGLGFEPMTSFNEVVRALSGQDDDAFNRMIYPAGKNLSVLATGSDALLDTSIQPQDFERLIDTVMRNHPLVFVDLSGAIPSLKRTVLNRAHQIILVTTPSLSALRLTRSLLQEIKLLHDGDLSPVDMVVNMSGMVSGQEVPVKDIQDALDMKPSVVVSFEPKLFLGSENEGKQMIRHKDGKPLIEKLLPMMKKSIANFPEMQDSHKDGKITLLLKKVGLGR